MSDIEKADRRSTVCPDIVINRSFPTTVVLGPIVVRVVGIILTERVGKTSVNDFVRVV